MEDHLDHLAGQSDSGQLEFMLTHQLFGYLVVGMSNTEVRSLIICQDRTEIQWKFRICSKYQFPVQNECCVGYIDMRLDLC